MYEVEIFNNSESVEMMEKTFLKRGRGSTVSVAFGNLINETGHPEKINQYAVQFSDHCSHLLTIHPEERILHIEESLQFVK